MRDTKIRTASVRCTEDTHLSYLMIEDFMHIYNNIMKGKCSSRVEFLKTIPLFNGLSKNYIQKMVGMFHHK